MISLLWLPTATKAVSTALLVVTASAIAERVGPFWGALVASLPVSTGPAYVFLGLQHEASFVAASALSSFAAHAATGVFLTTYGLLARTASLGLSLGAAILAWGAVGYATLLVTWTPLSALLLNIVVYTACLMALRVRHSATGEARPATPRRWHELPARAVAVALFVISVVALSNLLGPRATGLVAIFPIGTVCLAVILQPRLGGAATSLMAASSLRAMIGFGGMLFVTHLAIGPLGVATAMLLGLLTSLSWSAFLLLSHRRRRAASA